MTPAARSARPLSTRVAPGAGESLAGWIERVAVVHRTSTAEVLERLNLPYFALHPGYKPTAEIVTDTAWGAALDPAQIVRLVVPAQSYWYRSVGTRYCPACLAADGIWRRDWQHAWSFVCVEHAALLVDACPECGQAPRARPIPVTSAQPNPVGCQWPATGARGRSPARCPGIFTDGPRSRAAEILTAAQQWLHATLTHPLEVAAVEGKTRDATTSMAGQTIPLPWALRDCSIVALAAVRAHPPVDLARRLHLPEGNLTSPPELERHTVLHAAVSGVAASVVGNATSVHAAGTALGTLCKPDSLPSGWFSAWETEMLASGRPASPWLQAVVLACGDVSKPARSRLAQRTAGNLPVLPSDHHAAQDQPTDWPATYRAFGRTDLLDARNVPSCFDRAVTSRLGLEGAGHDQMTGAFVAMSLLAVGRTQRTWASIAADLELPDGYSIMPSRRWAELAAAGQDTAVLQALDLLFAAMVATRPPIDYRRRRNLFGRGTEIEQLTKVKVSRVLRAADSPRTQRRMRWVRLRLWEMLTGGEARMAPPTLAYTGVQDGTEARKWFKQLPDEPRQALERLAEGLLLKHRIDEPVSWQPVLRDHTWHIPTHHDARLLDAAWDSPSRRSSMRQTSRSLSNPGAGTDPIAAAAAGDRHATHRLQAFAAVTAATTFQAAAVQLGLTDSCLNARIARLEQDCQTQLVERAERGRNLTLTPAGHRLHAEIRRSTFSLAMNVGPS